MYSNLQSKLQYELQSHLPSNLQCKNYGLILWILMTLYLKIVIISMSVS